ncbi:putative Ankyrin repeat-containing protein [Melia azedarach]|uniref:Ankyrin repeat-containing protein n=1 Tax=Melia azedarach TaxID=155640 RepID=A0ACC1YHW0_MELAZ|nr:putative Ankyrin repeat-containing protein [Melia azedarach]
MLGMTHEAKDTILHEAVRYNHVGVVETLTREDPTLPYDANNAGETPLYFAVERGHKEVFQHILRTCKSPADHGPMGRSALQSAVLTWDIGASTRKADQRGWLPLHLAAHSGYYEIVKELLEVDKSSAYKADNEGKTALHLAALCGNINTSFLRCFNSITGKRYGRRQIVRGGDEAREEGSLFNKKSEGVKGKIKSRDDVVEEFVRGGQQAHLVVAALIATVTFTAGFTLPGGYVSEKGPHQGTAVLTRSKAFQAFVIFNNIAMIFSSCAVFLHCFVTRIKNKSKKFAIWRPREQFINYGMAAMVLAFLMGVYAALNLARELAITACAIGGLFLLVYCRFVSVDSLLRVMRKMVLSIERNIMGA